jgi:hypothetical protein
MDIRPRPHVCRICLTFLIFFLTLADGCVLLGSYILSYVGADVRRWGLALSIGPNWVGSTWRRRQDPASERLCFLNKTRTTENVQKYNNCIVKNVLNAIWNDWHMGLVSTCAGEYPCLNRWFYMMGCTWAADWITELGSQTKKINTSKSHTYSSGRGVFL